jgi:hypothetical protein
VVRLRRIAPNRHLLVLDAKPALGGDQGPHYAAAAFKGSSQSILSYLKRHPIGKARISGLGRRGDRLLVYGRSELLSTFVELMGGKGSKAATVYLALETQSAKTKAIQAIARTALSAPRRKVLDAILEIADPG